MIEAMKFILMGYSIYDDRVDVGGMTDFLFAFVDFSI